MDRSRARRCEGARLRALARADRDDARRGDAGWRELERQSGQELLDLYGLVELAPDPALTSAAALDECGVEYGLPTELEGIAIPDGWTALQVGDAGIVHADRARQAFLHGVDV